MTLGREPRILSDMDIGLRRGLPLYALGMQGEYGDQTSEKPWFGDIVGTLKWDAWEDVKGQTKELCQKLFIIKTHELFEEEGKSEYLVNANKPGPNYYSECKKYDWIEELIVSHKKHIEVSGTINVYGVSLDEEE